MPLQELTTQHNTMADEGYDTCVDDLDNAVYPQPAPVPPPPRGSAHQSAYDEMLEARAYARRYAEGMDIPCSHGVSIGACGRCNDEEQEEELALQEAKQQTAYNRAVRAEKRARDDRIRARIAEQDAAARTASVLKRQKELDAWAAVAAENAVARRDQSGGEDDDW